MAVMHLFPFIALGLSLLVLIIFEIGNPYSFLDLEMIFENESLPISMLIRNLDDLVSDLCLTFWVS